MKERLVVVGNGMAGMKVVEELVERYPDHFDIVVFGAEPHGNYNRIMLSPVLGGEKSFEDILIQPRDWYARNHIQLHAGTEKQVIEIDRHKRLVIAADGTTEYYDRLLLATGSNPATLNVPGDTLAGVMAFRNIADVEAMLSKAQGDMPAVVLGGGLLGLEAASGLRARGMEVTVVHHRAHILNRQLDAQASCLLQQALVSRGVKFRLSTQVERIIGDGNDSVTAVQFDDGETLTCGLFVMAIGVQPNIGLAKHAGLQCEQGVLVNDTMQTFDPRIYAVGECVQHRNLTFGLVAPLYEQARVCANHLARLGHAQYSYTPSGVRLKVSGIDLFSMGKINEDAQSEPLLFEDAHAGVYKKLLVENNRLVGIVLYGDTRDSAWYQELLETRADISGVRQALVFGQQALPPESATAQLNMAEVA